jgi:hypothetical protein
MTIKAPPVDPAQVPTDLVISAKPDHAYSFKWCAPYFPARSLRPPQG